MKTPWQLHFEKIAQENPHLSTNRDRRKKANEEWLKLHHKPIEKYEKPYEPSFLISSKPDNVVYKPPDKYPEGYKTPWQLHYEKVCLENPHIITYKGRLKKANEEWLKNHRFDPNRKTIRF